MTLKYLEEIDGNINIEELIQLKNKLDKTIDQNRNAKFKSLYNKFPEINSSQKDYSTDAAKVVFDEKHNSIVNEVATELMPWKKGPFNLSGLEIDSEWRSDFKWNRVEKSLVDLEGKTILDIGCNNGYFMFKMAKYNPKLALGIDPILQNKVQFDFLQSMFKHENFKFELWGVEHLPYFKDVFDVIFSMGIVYHHRNPIAQLVDIRNSLKPGGTVYLETIGIEGESSHAIFPEDRYAMMKNVWFVPTLSCFTNWVKRSKFINVELIEVSELTKEEQRLTKWCPPPNKSLEDFLDPDDNSKTIEGLPAPKRFLIKATKKPFQQHD